MNKVVKQAFANDGTTTAPPIYVMDDNKYANSDWVGAYMKKGVEQKHDLDVSGASENYLTACRSAIGSIREHHQLRFQAR